MPGIVAAAIAILTCAARALTHRLASFPWEAGGCRMLRLL